LASLKDVKNKWKEGERIDAADLKVHVTVRTDEEPLVLETPLETNKHRFPGELL